MNRVEQFLNDIWPASGHYYPSPIDNTQFEVVKDWIRSCRERVDSLDKKHRDEWSALDYHSTTIIRCLAALWARSLSPRNKLPHMAPELTMSDRLLLFHDELPYITPELTMSDRLLLFHDVADVLHVDQASVKSVNAFIDSTVERLLEAALSESLDKLPANVSILADALEDNGCPLNYPILVHLRATSVFHCRQCWALKLISRYRKATP